MAGGEVLIGYMGDGALLMVCMTGVLLVVPETTNQECQPQNNYLLYNVHYILVFEANIT